MMIRTHILPCTLPRALADALNLASGSIYTRVLVEHWRIWRKKHIWLSEGAGKRLNDSLIEAALHAHTIDAAQEGFYKACKTARAAKKRDPNAKYPHWPKKFRATIWKHSAIKVREGCLELSNGLHNPKITIALPPELQGALRYLEVRLVYDKKARRYTWHVVVENGVQPKEPPGERILSVDLGEVHPAVVGDEHEATIILCRERRHEARGHAKRLASIAQALSGKTRGSTRYRKLVRAKARLKAAHQRVIRDIEHKVSRAIVDVAVERQASILVIGDVRDVADGVALGKQTNQKISGWSHGKVRQMAEYKAQAEGIAVVLVDEHYTSQTCPIAGGGTNPGGASIAARPVAFSRTVTWWVKLISCQRLSMGNPATSPCLTLSSSVDRLPPASGVCVDASTQARLAHPVARRAVGEKPLDFSPRGVSHVGKVFV